MTANPLITMLPFFQVPDDRTRFAAGLFIPHENSSEELIENMSRVGFSSISIPEINKAVATVFPYRNPISVVIGIYRAYPALGRFNKVSSVKPLIPIKVTPP